MASHPHPQDGLERAESLFRVTTPPLVRDYRKRADATGLGFTATFSNRSSSSSSFVKPKSMGGQHFVFKQDEEDQDSLRSFRPIHRTDSLFRAREREREGSLDCKADPWIDDRSRGGSLARGFIGGIKDLESDTNGGSSGAKPAREEEGFDFDDDDDDEEGLGSSREGYLSSPSSLTACSTSTTAFSKSVLKEVEKEMDMLDLNEGTSAEHAQEEERKRREMESKVFMFFHTGVRAEELPDASRFPPQYKSQYTVTGQMRRIKIRREGPPLGKVVQVNGHNIAIFKFKGRCYAIENACCHQGGPLYQGDIEDLGEDMVRNSRKHIGGQKVKPCVACPWHGWKFDLETGQCLNNEGYSQGIYPCKIDLGQVLVGFEDFDKSTFEDDSLNF